MNKYLYNNALVAVNKNLSYKKVKEYLHGTPYSIDEVWTLVEEIRRNGIIAFKEKYKEYLNE